MATNGPCTITITSIPQDATVFIDGAYAGTTPVTNVPVSNGTHAVTISKEGYDDYAASVRIEESSHQDLIANLQKLANRGLAKIRTVPSGGILYVDGKYQNVTQEPVMVENLLPGRHDILIQKTGYEDYRDVISVAAGNMVEYTEYLVPLPRSGFLSITSIPEGADVMIDGRPSGVTPTNLKPVTAGRHTITLAKSGYWNFTGVLAIQGGESTVAKADLVDIPTASTLYIDSSPRGMGIYLNRTFKGETPATFESLPSGDYRVEFRNYDGSVNRSFGFRPGATYEIYASIAKGSGSIHSDEYPYQNQSRQWEQPGWSRVSTSPVIEQTYTWNTKGQESTVTLDIPKDLYEYYKNQPHPRNISTDTFSTYVINTNDRQYLHTLINKLKDASEYRSYAARNDYRNVVAFVQSIPYETDSASTGTDDYWKYPLETLADGSGDCEDKAILAAALLKEMGYDVAVVMLPEQEHAAVAVTCDTCTGYYYPLNGKRYYYLETTGAGFSPGIMDKKFQSAKAKIIPI